jgi:hypothetical protein
VAFGLPEIFGFEPDEVPVSNSKQDIMVALKFNRWFHPREVVDLGEISTVTVHNAVVDDERIVQKDHCSILYGTFLVEGGGDFGGHDFTTLDVDADDILMLVQISKHLSYFFAVFLHIRIFTQEYLAAGSVIPPISNHELIS